MRKRIHQVVVLGAGVMGSRIACHLANAGLQVLLLDMVPPALNEKEKQQGLTEENPAFRNRIVNDALQAAVKSKPSPIFHNSVLQRIRTGNFEDDLHRIATCDWIIEAVVEQLLIKQSLFEKVEQHRKPGTYISTNTSGIPIHLLAEGRSPDFRRHFCGTHFFNPPRYLPLLEIIPGPETLPEVVDTLSQLGDRVLGKTTVICKDTPAFIANRIGVYSMMLVFRLMERQGWKIEEIDALTGPLIGHPKSATFRTADVVGIDTMVHVARGLYENCTQDEQRDLFQIPAFLQQMVNTQRLGDKTGEGFYKKIKSTDGQSEIRVLRLDTQQYEPRQKFSSPAIEQARNISDLGERLRFLHGLKDRVGEFFRHFTYALLAYVSHRIPEIADELYKVDDAMRAGFGWEMGPFEIWEALGVAETTEQMEKAGYAPAHWVKEMLQKGNTTFYLREADRVSCYDPQQKEYRPVPGSHEIIVLRNYSQQKIWENAGTTLYHVGDGVLNLAIHTKMNTIGSEVIQGIQKAIEFAEANYEGLVIGQESPNFSAGANVALILTLALEQEWDELSMAVQAFQQTSLRIRYARVPVVVAARGLTLGGGCEFCLHADAVQAHSETYMGLVEVGVGLIPAGGGSKEMTQRASEAYHQGEIDLPKLQERFLTIAMAKVSTSAQEAFDLQLLRPGYDRVTMNANRLLADAKQRVLEMARSGYVPPSPPRIKVLGREALGLFLTGIYAMQEARYISEHDAKVAQKLAYVMSGGDLSEATEVNESYLLDLEREAFLSLCGEPKTLERLQSVLKQGRPVRN
ncbi:3-hydroxyacyl-CoA dehydrogenase/enoyl-CoA hydratase family protein [Thermoflavifilum thermophilum]|uniref:3-hydroxyacyl-CoA dehydrogenase n=1 Tax=Thermoflavifilum thermophilum TaxID=1393122 RepID=A0A1I7N5S8_9BACT|nr:3-hydroxyacyl-CoA dehydrogenase/enoyl-CoA hydratase family protein [Thermoflavifilum thermophilum]SFV30005.1 3-hydroxyacyl-CoA dehydrogenase [Thermoflavifilum thermophilum]